MGLVKLVRAVDPALDTETGRLMPGRLAFLSLGRFAAARLAPLMQPVRRI